MTYDNKPFCQASDNNKSAILQKLAYYFSDTATVLEIGSGTGQHATYFAASLEHLIWCPSDLPEKIQGIEQWLDSYPSENLIEPLKFNVAHDDWPLIVDGVFTANTTHIMSPVISKIMMEKVAANLVNKGRFLQYGPFKVDGKFTTASNENFNDMLVSQGYGGIRDIAELERWGGPELVLQKAIEMPANNLLLVWQKICL